jgi:glycogen debranching enzyme
MLCQLSGGSSTSQSKTFTEYDDELNSALISPEYTIDNRPLCQGMPFLLTDAAHPRLVLKYGNHFLVMDEAALIPGCNTLGYGYYRYDTRHISQWEMALRDVPLSILSSSVSEGYAGSFLYTNPQTDTIPQQKLTVQRDVVLSDLLWEKITLHNFHNEPIECQLNFKFQSDFADIFEVRGYNPPERGKRMRPVAGKNGRSLFLAYKGLDDSLLETVIEFFGLRPASINESDGEVIFNLSLNARESQEFQICVSTQWDGKSVAGEARKTGYFEARSLADHRYTDWTNHRASIGTDHELFDLAIERSFRDIYILRQPSPKGYGLSAGVPWYCAIFGRDSAIAAWQILPFVPDLSRECIEVLAAYQGEVVDDYKDEEPGRIMHELRLGELARTGQIPHSPYFGTIDATQLWLYLLAQYIDWSGNLDFARKMWPAVQQSLQWLKSSLSTGYLTYKRISEKGLVNQGWKDSGDSVMHTNGVLAEPPIALCEAQAYLYACWREIAKLANLLGYKPLADSLFEDAEALKCRFQKDFWMADENYLALALDRHGHQMQVISSNPGHCLFTGILDDDKANAVADRLMNQEMHSGWGIRTLSRSTLAYNPMGYHNGTVWPHDNAIIAEGMRKIGRPEDAHTIMGELLEVAQFEPDFRLPELICGFDRVGSFRPIDYPVSCSPQAWAAGSVFQLIKACANLQPDAANNIVRVVDPSLPKWLGKLVVRGLRVGEAIIDLSFANDGGITSCHVLHKSGKVRVVVES